MPDDELQIPKAASRMFQITEEDLADLEKMLPDLMHAHAARVNTAEKVKWRQVIEIIKNVRWCYGPWLECHELKADSSEPDDSAADWWKEAEDA